MALAGTGAELSHLTPRPEKDLWGSNYLNIAGNDFNFAKQFLPEVYEKEVERYGNRTISGFLKMVGAEMPMAYCCNIKNWCIFQSIHNRKTKYKYYYL